MYINYIYEQNYIFVNKNSKIAQPRGCEVKPAAQTSKLPPGLSQKKKREKKKKKKQCCRTYTSHKKNHSMTKFLIVT